MSIVMINFMPSNVLDYITIRGFKSIASIEKLALKPINVVIGPNGSGKSNFIGVFYLLHEILAGRLREYVAASAGAEKVLHFGSKTTKEVGLRLYFATDATCYELNLAATADDGLFPSSEMVGPAGESFPYPDGSFGHVFDPLQQGSEAAISNVRIGSALEAVAKRLNRWRPYHFHDTSSSSHMRKTATVDDNRFLRQDGANLPAFLYLLREKHQSSYDLIVQTVQRVAPFFEDFRLDPLLLNPETIKLEWRHKKYDQYFDASSLSDGTLRFIALATLFLQPEQFRPSLILVDEPELGLHPYALGVVASLIRQASVMTQVIVSTQSSLLLDHFNPEDVLVADRVNGGTELTRLNSAQLAKWLEDYSLGQLWEKNELGGRPTPA